MLLQDYWFICEQFVSADLAPELVKKRVSKVQVIEHGQ